MVNGVHAIIYSKDAEADLAFFRDVLKFPYVDAGRGWLIFRLPPPELAIHPSSDEEKHELYLTCDDIAVFVGEMGKAGVVCGPIQEQRWGSVTQLTLPGGGTLGIYQPRHARPV